MVKHVGSFFWQLFFQQGAPSRLIMALISNEPLHSRPIVVSELGKVGQVMSVVSLQEDTNISKDATVARYTTRIRSTCLWKGNLAWYDDAVEGVHQAGRLHD